MMTDF